MLSWRLQQATKSSLFIRNIMIAKAKQIENHGEFGRS